MNIQKIGITVFVSALVIALASLWMGRFELDTKQLKSSVGNDYHIEVIQKHTSTLTTTTYNNVFAFVNALDGALNAANNEIKAELASKDIDQFQGEYWSTIIQEYKISNIKYEVSKASAKGYLVENIGLMFFLVFGLAVLGAMMYILPKSRHLSGIKNNGIFQSALHNRGWIGMILGAFLIGFYIVLYFHPYYMVNWIILVDPLSIALSTNPASQWFLYGFLYTLAVLVMGVRMIIKYRHNNYQMVRTGSVMFFQLAFAFIIPQILAALHQPSPDLKNIWPLDYDFFYKGSLNEMIQAGTIGYAMLIWGILLIIIGVPVFTYFFGKRWYCSWVCGCGGLAETLGDPFRQQSDKRLKAWRIERWVIHGVMIFAIIMTGAFLYTFFTGSENILVFSSENIKKTYGFLISSIFAGVIGTGFYPLMGNRVWCRFGCPLAAYLGMVQRFKSRFRITTNGGQCISCGNCSTYCEMGIDVRAYAQRGQDIVRSSCVGCGICSAVCPRGVLKLENADGDVDIRTHELRALHIDANGVQLINE